MYREIGCGKSGLLQLVSERGCDSVDLLSMESIMNRVSWYRMNYACIYLYIYLVTTSVIIKEVILGCQEVGNLGNELLLRDCGIGSK